MNHGVVKAAQLTVKQSEINVLDVQNQILSEIYSSYNRYIAYSKKLDLYKNGILSDAEKVLQGRIYSYQHGETGLFDVLNAQRTYADLQKDYIEARYELINSLIDLEFTAGIWDLNQVF